MLAILIYVTIYYLPRSIFFHYFTPLTKVPQLKTTTVSRTPNARERANTTNHRPHASSSTRQKKSKSRILTSKLQGNVNAKNLPLSFATTYRLESTPTSFVDRLPFHRRVQFQAASANPFELTVLRETLSLFELYLNL